MKNRLDTFKGIIPAVEPSLLPESVAQEAHNCDLSNGKLVPLNHWLDTGESVDDDIETIYHFRAFGKGDCDLPLPDPYWVKFPFDADFVPSPINGDKYERVFYTGNPDGQVHQLFFGEDATGIPLDHGATLNPPIENISNGGIKDMINHFDLFLGVYDDYEDPNTGERIVKYYPADDPLICDVKKLSDTTWGENLSGTIRLNYTLSDDGANPPSQPFHVDITGHSGLLVSDFDWSTRTCFLVKVRGLSGKFNPPSYTPFTKDGPFNFFTSKGPNAGDILDLYDPYWNDNGYTDQEILYGHVGLSTVTLIDDGALNYVYNQGDPNFMFSPVPSGNKEFVVAEALYDFTKKSGMNLGAEAEYNYVYQYIDSHGTPSPIYGEKAVDDKENVSKDSILFIKSRRMCQRLVIDVPELPPTENNGTGLPIKYVRVFRSMEFTKTGSFLMIQEIEITDTPEANNPYQWDGNGTYSFPDWTKEIPGFEWDDVTPPPECLKGLVIHPGRFLAGFKKDAVFLSEVNAPYSWPEMITIDSPIVGLAINGSDIVVLTSGTPTILSGMNPHNMRLTKMAIQQSCVSKKSICKVGDIVTYASPDGIVFISGGQGQLATKGLIHPKQWRALRPEELVAVQHDSKVWFTPGVDDVSYCFDPRGEYLSLITVDGNFKVSYNDLFDDALYFVQPLPKKIFSFDADLDVQMDVRWRTARFDYNTPIMFIKCRVIAEEYPVYLDIYVDEHDYKTMIIMSERVYNLPLRRRDEVWSFRVRCRTTIRRLELGQSMDDFIG